MTGSTVSRAERLRRSRARGQAVAEAGVENARKTSGYNPHETYHARRSSVLAYITGALQSASRDGDAEFGAFTRGVLEVLDGLDEKLQ